MQKITFKDYKEAIKRHYKIAITEDVSGILANPSPAQMRNLCFIVFNKGIDRKDEEVFRLFFETKENESLKRSIEHCNIDKFKSIISFLKSDTDSENSIRIEMSAILLDYKPRPYNVFSSSEKLHLNDTVEDNITTKNEVLHSLKTTEIIKSDKIEGNPSTFKKKIAVVFLSLLGIFFASYTAKDIIFPEKECMQWQKDHYELVDCEVTGLVSTNAIEPVNKGLLHLKRIFPCDTTTFFEYDKPKVWYHKMNSDVEFYNSDGNHPITGKELKPITQHMIDNYIGSCK